MKILSISRDLLNGLLSMGANWHPNEFVALLREENGIISEIDLLPGTTSGANSAALHIEMMPLDTHIAGSVHSHPNGVLKPSPADIHFFPRTGRYHIIIGYPYREDDWCCYSADGVPLHIEVVE